MTYLFRMILPFFMGVILVLSCCTGNRGGDTGLYGKPGEVLVVMADEAWAGSPGALCRELFGSPYEILPQYEPLFDISHINTGSYRDFFLLHRNIIVTGISPDVTEASMRVQEDPLVSTQLVIRLLAPDDSSFMQLLSANGEQIIDLLVHAERNRITMTNKRNAAPQLTQSIRSRFAISLDIPGEYQTVLDTTGFLWLQKASGSVIQGILIYKGKMPEMQEVLTMPYLIRYRDELLERYVPGSVPGSYMTTEKEFAPVPTSYGIGDGFKAMEIRGLWRMENGMSMGGPFLSLTRYQDHLPEFITVEGFVFAAGFSKRNYMRELEAVISTLE